MSSYSKINIEKMMQIPAHKQTTNYLARFCSLFNYDILIIRGKIYAVSNPKFVRL